MVAVTAPLYRKREQDLVLRYNTYPEAPGGYAPAKSIPTGSPNLRCRKLSRVLLTNYERAPTVGVNNLPWDLQGHLALKSPKLTSFSSSNHPTSPVNPAAGRNEHAVIVQCPCACGFGPYWCNWKGHFMTLDGLSESALRGIVTALHTAMCSGDSRIGDDGMAWPKSLLVKKRTILNRVRMFCRYSIQVQLLLAYHLGS